MATVLITGANRGIGLAFARAFAERGEFVIGTARNPDAATELAAVADRVLPLDVTDGESCSALGMSLIGETVDLLINNAGILRRDTFADAQSDSVIAQFDTNAMGPLRVVQALHPNLLLSEAPAIVCLTSRMGSITDNTSGGSYGYRASKAAFNAIIKSLSIDLAPWPVVALHPGWIRTEMTSGTGDMGPEDAVKRMLAVIDEMGTEHTGRFFHRDGQQLPW